MRPKRTQLSLWISVLALAYGCAQEPEPDPQPAGAAANVLLISIDTLRADHLGCYGYDRPTSPGLDELCRDSAVFEQAMAHAPSTVHSHASILTSLLPHHHNASWGAKTALSPEALTLAEVLGEAGYATAAFTGGGQMDRVFGLDQGFDLYQQPGHERFAGTVGEAVEWLEQEPREPFFLFLHTYETHHPYEPEAEYLEAFDTGYSGDLPDAISVDFLRALNRKEFEVDEADVQHIVNTYDGEIRSMDHALGGLMAYLKEQGLYENTLIVFTSDHGEEFGEHGRIGWHSHSLYDELLHVPLVVKFPGDVHSGVRSPVQVRGIDIAPTILASLGIGVPDEFAGTDLAGVLAGSSPVLPAISRRDRPARRTFDSIRVPGWKLYQGQLFDLNDDPEELWDTAFSNPTKVRELEEFLESELAAREGFDSPRLMPTDKTLEELRKLGYIQ